LAVFQPTGDRATPFFCPKRTLVRPFAQSAALALSERRGEGVRIRITPG
jgi:hypothetical protein